MHLGSEHPATSLGDIATRQGNTAAPGRQEATSDGTAVDDALVRITEFCQGILDWSGSPAARERMLQRADVALPTSAFVLLRVLAHAESVTVSRLADYVGLHASTVSTQLRPLDEAGLIRRQVDAVDRRVVALSITPAGREVCERVRQAGARQMGAVLADWPAEDLAQLAGLLERVRSNGISFAMARAAGEVTPSANRTARSSA